MRNNQINTQNWVWKTMVKTGLIPLVLVESVLIAVYLFSNHFISSENMNYIYKQVNSELKISAQRESTIVSEKLSSISRLTELYKKETERVLSADHDMKSKEASNLILDKSGVLYSKENLGLSASFYSAFTEQKDLQKVYTLEQLDPLMQHIQLSDKNIAAVYFNSWDSYNRIYPWFFTLDQYPEKMNIPEYNFYYLADKAHNPDRNPVWTDVYIDPAGQGWMASSIAPVYKHNFLEGVVGLDLTVSSIINNIKNLSVPWGGYAILTSNNGNIMALPPQGETDFQVKELTDHSYQKTISEEVFKPQEFNLSKRNNTKVLSQVLHNATDGFTQLQLNNANKFVAWSTIPETQWKLLLIVDENKMYHDSRLLEEKYQNIGYMMIYGLIGFYIIFLAYIWYSSKKMTAYISTPLAQIQNMLYQISNGHFNLTHRAYKLKEIDETANSIVSMGHKLDTLTSELRNSKIEAENANIAKNQFISNISHEIRTPMNFILGISHLLLAQNLSPEQKNHLSKIDKASKHLLTLINNILDLSKLDSGKVKIEKIPFRITDIVNDVYDIFEHKANNKGLELDVNVDTNIPVSFIGDPLRVKQILLNYVSNAIKFTENGYVSIDVKLIEQTEASAQIRICVTDSGIGLSDKQIVTIFDSFQQADASTTRKYGGSGLGLSICKNMAELMDGTVGVKSQPSAGSTFWLDITFPINHWHDNQPENTESAICSNHKKSDPKNTCTPLSEHDIQKLTVKLHYLRKLLSDNDLEVDSYFTKELEMLSSVDHHLAQRLAKLIVSFEFEQALKVTDDFVSLLKNGNKSV